jgi:hypothetical protein
LWRDPDDTRGPSEVPHRDLQIVHDHADLLNPLHTLTPSGDSSPAPPSLADISVPAAAERLPTTERRHPTVSTIGHRR